MAGKHVPLEITILGSGTSTGVPIIGCSCNVCQSSDPTNNRTRASIMIERLDTGERLVIDTSPDFRFQMLRHKVSKLQHVIYTHVHSDHLLGFDDLRAYYFFSKKPVDCYLQERDIPELKERFRYAFEDTGYVGVPPKVNIHTIRDEPFEVMGLKIEPVFLPHGSVQTVGYRFGSFAYLTDFKLLPEKTRVKWRGLVRTMIASGVQYKPHPTHSSIPETLHLFAELGLEKGIITHLSHVVDYPKDKLNIPEPFEFAYDGMKIQINVETC